MTSHPIETTIDPIRTGKGIYQAHVKITAPGLSAHVSMTWDLTGTFWFGDGPSPSMDVDGIRYQVHRFPNHLEVTDWYGPAPVAVTARVAEAFWTADAAFVEAVLSDPQVLRAARRAAADAEETAVQAARVAGQWATAIDAMEKAQKASV